MRVTKATPKDLDAIFRFMQWCEMALEAQRYSMESPEQEWKKMDEDEPEFKLIKKQRKDLADEEGISEEDVDDRILMYEFLKMEFSKTSARWRRVYTAADILIEAVCDPTDHCLAYFPGLELNHVAPEM